MEKTQIKSKYYKLLFVGLIIGLFPFAVSAATLTFSPISGTYSAGSQITVNVYVSSADQSMNAVSGAISFSTKYLSVSSVSKAYSIISLWTVDPTFSASAGTVNFEGIVLNPGFIGSNGRIISITFTAKSVGNASVTFDSGSVLANDGIGTSLPTTFGSAQFVITSVSPSTNAVQLTAPVAPTISVISPTINYYSKAIHEGNSIVIKGNSRYPDSKVIIWLEYNKEDIKSYPITNNKYGDFVFAETSGAKTGTYKVWAQSVDENGGISSSSPTYAISVSSPFTINIFGYDVNIIAGLSIAFLILLILIFVIQKMVAKKCKTRDETLRMILHANKIANVKLKYFNDYVGAQLDILEKDKKFKTTPGALDVIEKVREHIADYKEFIDREKK